MRRDYLIAIILAVAAIPAGTALMAAPEYLHLTGTSLAVTFWGGVALTLALIFAAVVIALRGESKSPPLGHRRRMVAIIGMAVFGAGFIACAVWFFSQRPYEPTGSGIGNRATLEVATGGEISARAAEMPNDLPFTFGRAETGGKINMDGIKVVREPPPEAQGGKGGSGEIFGDNGTIIGGKGGNVGPGAKGRGGDGGGGVIHGSGGTIIGGDGGSVDGSNIWYPPAQSGYIQYLESQGQTPDFNVQYPGSGGATGGWLQRQQVVIKIREEYFKATKQDAKLSSSKIDDVPLNYINEKLKAAGYPWRARIDRKYWYLYYVPNE